MMILPPEISEENLTLEVTTRCTSACRHCFARAGRSHLPEMTPDTARAIITEGRRLGFRRLHLTGGEPLLWGGLRALMENALDLGYEHIFLNSNGHLLTPERAEDLAAVGKALEISISLQGPAAHHDYFRGEGSYRRAEAGIAAALEAGIATHIFTTVDRGLVEQIPRFVDDVEWGFKGITCHTLIQLVRVHDDALSLSDDLLSPDDFVSLVKMCSLLSLSGRRIYILENPLAVAAARLLGMDWLPQAPSLHRSGRLVILADGEMTLAHSTRAALGRYRKGMVERVITSPHYIESVAEDRVTCPACPFFDTCREAGMLRPSEWFRQADDAGPVPFCRRVLEAAKRTI